MAIGELQVSQQILPIHDAMGRIPSRSRLCLQCTTASSGKSEDGGQILFLE